MKKSNRKSTEVSYWESMADSMVALVLCILLVMMLLMLYLVRIDDNDMQDDRLGYSYEQYDDPDDGGGNHSYGKVDDEAGDAYERDDDDGGGGYGGGGGGTGTDDFSYEDPDPGAGEGEGLDRAAVLVQVIDGETERTIKKAGITFELYNTDAVLQTLNTYYPKKISYKQYKTDENGVFYLPERLVLDTYYLHCLTVVPGYDTGDNCYFEIDQGYDWDDPFVVNVRLYPSKSVIELHLKDASDAVAISGAAFQVIAAENVTTADGTLRYQENSVVDNITIGADGTGRSKELYLGSYLLRQTGVPEYYGKIEQEEQVTLKARTAAKQQEVVNLYAEKTSVEITAVDELYDTVPLTNASFTLRTAAGTILQQFTTDTQGRFAISNLKKNTDYQLQQETAPEGYQKQLENLTFRVSSEGYIDGTVSTAMEVTNRTLRISVGVQDKLFRNFVSDVNLALMDAEGNIIKNWSTTGMEQVIEGLSSGEYKLIMGGNQDNAMTILVEDKAELQEFRLERWTTADIATLIVVSAVSAGLLVLLIWLLKNQKAKRKGSEQRDG